MHPKWASKNQFINLGFEPLQIRGKMKKTTLDNWRIFKAIYRYTPEN